MPKRTDMKTVLLIGSGPIVIGQACEFDYSGTQACKALKEEGYRVVLVNSNPATIMTDPEFADRTYIEPLTPEVIERIIEAERPDALLPTMGGQTALNLAMQLAEAGVLKKHGVELIGATYEAIRKAEHRDEFKRAMARIGLKTPASGYAKSWDEALRIAETVGFPCVIRPSFTLGGTGAGVAYNREEFERAITWALAVSPVHEVLIEASVLGWKEFELEVMRDRADNVSIVCSIENLDPMGIHTGDSITVAPAQTLTDREYQRMRDAAIRIMREVGVDTGGSNIQFAVHPETGEMHVIEMNPRVSRSSALASKATGYPIAKIATRLAIGYTLDEIWNDMTRVTPASFEPTIDYVVVKIPRFAFEKFPQADPLLTTQMKSVGEAMAIGRTFKEALQKAVRSLEIDSDGLESRTTDPEAIRRLLKTPTEGRLWAIADALRAGLPMDEVHALTRIDPWFLHQIREIVETEAAIQAAGLALSPEALRQAKAMGFADRRLAALLGTTEDAVRERRLAEPSASGTGIKAVFKRVDTCGAEFEAQTSYLYSTYESEDEARPTRRKKIIILGSGPNRIGQGIEFDYCCVHAVFALREEGYETIMVNCNPETVSTDYDTADRLYFEPLTREDVLNIIETERPDGVVVQFGGQTPLKLALPLEAAGVTILGTSPDAIDQAEDRERFRALIETLGLRQPASGIAQTAEEAVAVAGRLTYPVMVRPSYVLGGRAMEIVYDEASLRDYIAGAVRVSAGHPILIDKYLEDAIEVDVDAVADGHEVLIGGILEHIEEAGVHSGDASMSLPPHSLGQETLDAMADQTTALARALNVVGLMNVQFAVKHGEVYVLEVNPRASRTVPFVSKATGVPLAKLAMKVMVGRRLRDLGLSGGRLAPTPHIAVKESVFPFNKFRGVDTLLGPEMKSTGEVMGLGDDFGLAFAKSQTGAYGPLPTGGRAYLSVKDKDKPAILPIAQRLVELGFALVATRGTADFLRATGLQVETVNKVQEGRPHGVDRMKNREIHLVINTVGDKRAQEDSYTLRRTALEENLPYFTTVAAAGAVVRGLEALQRGGLRVKPLQAYHRDLAGGPRP